MIKKIIENVIKFFDDFKIPFKLAILLFFSFAFIVLYHIPLTSYSVSFGSALAVVVGLAPIWLPVFLAFAFWSYWVVYVRADFLKNQNYTLLEIRLPREVDKSPQAMEAFLKGIHISPGETTFINRYWEGKIRPWFSLEIISVNGEVRFFLWIRTNFKRFVESQMYAHYPQVEIYEVSDYTDSVDPDLKDKEVWGSNFVLTKPDAYPIKTYIDHGLDREEKEERKVDPISSLIEFMGSMDEGEMAWVQILFQKYQNKKKFKVFGFEKKDWKDEAEKEINKIMKRDEKTKGPESGLRTPEGFAVSPTLSEVEKDQLKAISRSLNKPGFDSMIRGIYITDSDKFDPANIAGLISSIGAFGSETLNSFKPSGFMSDYKYPWQNYPKSKKTGTKKELIEAFKRREFMHPPFKEKTFVLNSEEIATIYHFPGWITQPPSLNRIPSRKGRPPSDLPV